MRRGGINIIKRLIVLIDSLIPVMICTILAGVAGYLCAIAIPVLGGMGILKVLGLGADNASLKTIFTAIAACALLRGLLHYGEQLSGHYIAFKVLAILRDKVFKALRNLAPAKMEVKEQGNLVSLITSDIELLEVFYAHTIAPVAIALMVSAIMIMFIGSYNIIFGLIAAVAYFTVGAIIPVVNSRTGRERGDEYRKIFGKASSFCLESLRGMKESIQYNCGYKHLDSIESMTEELNEQQKKLKNHEGSAKALTDGSIYLFSMAILFLGIYMMEHNIIEFDRVLVPTMAMFSSFGPVIALSSLSNNLVQTFASADRVLDILDEVSQTPEVKDGKDVEFSGAEFDDVSFAYDNEKILENINIDINENSITGISGKSGSGKSTLLKLLMRFWDTKKGSIKLSDEDIKHINTKNLRAMESYMTQETFLFNGTIEENIKLGNLKANMDDVIDAAKEAAVHEFIMTLPKGYKTKVGELGDRLSGGEKQRIGLARAFIHDSRLMILDEPTSNLDSLNEAIILKSLVENPGSKTVILVSHRKSTLKIADEIYELRMGRVS